MQEMGLEPTRYCYHRHLKPARLPIPPLLHFRCACILDALCIPQAQDICYMIYIKLSREKVKKNEKILNVCGFTLILSAAVPEKGFIKRDSGKKVEKKESS